MPDQTNCFLGEKIFKLLRPDQYCPNILDIDASVLKEQGVKGIILDLDNTLVPRREKIVSPAVINWIEQMKAKGLKVVIVSNNWTKRVTTVAERVKLPLIAPAGKPSRRAFKKGLKILGTSPEETAVIGDQLFTDIIGGKRMRLFTILVSPVGNDEMFHTRVLRRLERRILNRLRIKNKVENDSK